MEWLANRPNTDQKIFASVGLAAPLNAHQDAGDEHQQRRCHEHNRVDVVVLFRLIHRSNISIGEAVQFGSVDSKDMATA